MEIDIVYDIFGHNMVIFLRLTILVAVSVLVSQ